MVARSPLSRLVTLLVAPVLLGGLVTPAGGVESATGVPRVDGTADPGLDDTRPADAGDAEGVGAADPDGEALALTDGLPVEPETFGAASPEDVPDDDSAGTSAVPSGVEDGVREVVDDGGSAAVIIRLREQVDIDAVAERAVNAANDAMAESARGRDAEAARTARVRTVVDELRRTARTSQEDVQDLLAEQEGAGHADGVEPYWIFNGFSATVDEAALNELADHPDVASVTLDEEIALPEPIEPEPGEPLLPSWSLEKVNAPDVWGEYGVRGDGVVVGIMDGGVDGEHPALADSWRGNDGDPAASWYAPTGENYPTPGDGGGHGTHVAGSIVGNAPGELTGVAPDAEWIAAKIFRDSGSTSASIIHDGFQWMLAPGGDPEAAPDVVNNSWGSDAATSAEFWDDVAAWEAAGIVPMFANGNNGPAPGTVGSPASFPNAIGIGATGINDLVRGFSSRGPAAWDGQTYRKPQVSAPGHLIRSAWPEDLIEEGYRTISGTSMAAPHATGVVALMLSAAPDLSIDDIRTQLQDTARAESHMGEMPNDNYGAGIVDAYAAVTRVAHSGTLSGTVTGPDGPLAATVTVGEATTTTDEETGAYEMPVPEGEHTVTISAYGYVESSAEVAIVTGQASTLDAGLEAAAEHELSGTVAGADGPLAHARVSVTGTPVEPARTGDDGRFALTVAAGTYQVRVRAAGHEPVELDVTIDGDEELEITLDPLSQPSADGWAQYQNNAARSGLSGDSLAADTLEPSWTADAGGDVVFASPVIAAGMVLHGSDDGRLTARDATSGERRWTFQAGEALRGTPAVAGGQVYTGGGLAGGLDALDLETGEERWSVPTPDRLTVYTAPSVVDGVVYAATGPTQDREDTVFALDAETGEQLWATDVGTSVFAGPAVGDGVAVVGNADDGELIGLDAETGDRIWTLTRQDDYFIGGASVVDGAVYVPTTDGDGGGSLLAVEAESGQPLWEAEAHGDGQGTAPAVYGDLVIAGSHGLGLVVAYDRETGEAVWHHGVSGAVSASVMVTDDGYVVGGSQLDQRVWALDAATGELVWDADAEANVTSSAAYAEGQLVTADTSGNLYAFHPTGTVAGTVTGPDGPVAATVTVAETGAEVRTDPETGRFELTHAPGEYTVEISSYGLTSETRAVDVVAGRTVTVDAQLEAVGDGSVAGEVRDEDGDALSGVVVTLAGAPHEPVTTAADGAFAFDNVAAGTYDLEAELTGYAPLNEPVEVTAGETTSVELTLSRYDVAVVGDDDGTMLSVLEDLGYSVESTDYADVTSRAGDFSTVVANGARGTDPGQEAFLEFVEATDAAGTSVIWLDQWSLGWGAINHLVDHVGDPEVVPDDYAGAGRVSLVATVEHPLTEGLTVGERTEILTPGSAWSAFDGYSGTTVADLHTDDHGVTGGGIGYAPRGPDSVHVLLGSLAAAATWGNPETDWLDAAEAVFDNAVSYAAGAEFGEVSGTVTAESGDPVTATVEVPDTAERTTTAEDGTYQLFLPPGEHTLRFSRVGATPVERTVTVEAGASVTVDATLADSGAGALSGTVTSARDGEPVDGAQVALAGTDLESTTDADGAYTIADVPGGAYDLDVSADGHFTATVSVEVAAGEETVADVELDAAPRVGVIEDYAGDGVVDLMAGAEIEAEEIGWEDVDRVDEFDVVVFNDPDDPGEEQFLDFLDALDEAEVSGIFPDDRFSSYGGARLLREYLGDPAGTEPVSGEGIVSYAPAVPEHPLFEGLAEQPEVLRAGRYAAALVEYSGTTLAELVTEEGGDHGVGAAYTARTPGSVHLLLGGMAATLFQGPDEDWTEDGRRMYLNAVRWAAAPGLGSVEGTVVGAEGTPLPATVEVVETGAQVEAGDDGSYVLPLEPGEYTLRISSFGYAPAEHQVSVEPNAATSLDVELEPADVGSVSGMVTAGADIGTGPLADGEPVAGATVSLVGTPLRDTTGEDGSYALELVEPGTYELEVLAEDHVRTRAQVTVTAGEVAQADVELRPSPVVGVIDDHEGRLAGYLEHWGYAPEPLTWEETGRLGDLGLVVANLGSYPRVDPGAEGFAAFDDAANRAGVPVVWLDQFGRGSFRYLSDYGGDPAVVGQGRSDGEVTVGAAEPDHPLLDGLPESFPLVEAGEEYSWFDEFSGTTVATVSTDDEDGRGLAGVRHRGAGAVDVLLGTLSVSTYGYPASSEEERLNWTPHAERLLRNAVGYALDGENLGAEVRGTLADAAGTPLTGEVTVVETGMTYPARDGDGSFVVPLEPGEWTLEASSFGYVTSEIPVSVEAGDVLDPAVELVAQPMGTVTGTVTGPGGDPVTGADVTISGTPLSVSTGDHGGYLVEGVPEGDWTLRVTADGYQVAAEPITVTDGETLTLDVDLASSQAVAVVRDVGDSITDLLEAEGHEVEQIGSSDLAGLAERISEFQLVVFNGTVLSSQREAFAAAVDAAEEAQVSVLFAGQWGGYAIGALSDYRGDPGEIDDGFVPEAVEYVPAAEHPIFTGYPAGEPIELIANPGGNQQWMSYSGYSGSTVANLRSQTDGADLGEAVGYRFSSPSSVEILMGGLAASSYGSPGDGWTADAERIYLNAVEWAVEARQAEVTGVVTSDGAPVPDATVTAVEDGARATTDDDGAYALGLSAGTHTVRVEAFGFETAEHSVDVPESGTTTLDFELVPLPRGEVVGTVTSSVDGEPVAGALLAGDGPSEWTSTSDDAGAYAVDDLLEGEYEVTVTADGFLAETAEVTVTADDPATLDVELRPLDVGVLGDVDGVVSDLLGDAGEAAAPLAWDLDWEADGDAADQLDRYEVIVVNGGSPDQETFDAMLDAADDAEISLVFTGTWGADRGGVRLLERHTDRVSVGAQGYGDGPVELTGFDGDHTLFEGLDDPARLIVDGGYYSVLESYAGQPLADLSVDREGVEPVSGLAAGFDWRTIGSIEVVLSASAVTEAVGPGLGWTDDASRLLVNAVSWARAAEHRAEDWKPEWSVEGHGRVRPVMLELDGASWEGAPTAPPAASGALVVSDSDGIEVARYDMRWVSGRYMHMLSGLPGGDYVLSAELDVDGLAVELDGPEITVPG